MYSFLCSLFKTLTLYCKNVLTFILTLLQNYLGVSEIILKLLQNYLGVSNLHHSWPQDGCSWARPQCCPVLERLQRGWSLVKYFCYNVEIFFQVGVIIMVPALLGLKGNLEMTLASRLSTACNLGKLDCREVAVKMILGNLVLVQCQGIVVGFLASIVGMMMGWIPEAKFNLDHALLLMASAIVTASIASLALGIIMVAVILLARRLLLLLLVSNFTVIELYDT